jgi:hypothetical protein
MPSIEILLKRDMRGEWRLYAPKGHEIAGPFRGNKYDAYDWGRAWCSTWKDWTVVQQDEEDKYEKTD